MKLLIGFLLFIAFLDHRITRADAGRGLQGKPRTLCIFHKADVSKGSEVQVKFCVVLHAPVGTNGEAGEGVAQSRSFLTGGSKDEAAGQCYGHSEEVCAAVNSNATLPFTANGTDSRWTWQKNGNDLCFCRDLYLDCETKYQEYRSRIKTFCEILAVGNGNLTILDVKEHDDAIYALCDERGHCTCVHLAVKPDETGCKNGGSQTKELPVQNPTDPPSDPGANEVWKIAAGVAVPALAALAALVVYVIWQKQNPEREPPATIEEMEDINQQPQGGAEELH